MSNYVVWANVACLANVILCSVNVNRSAFTCCGLLSSFCSYVLFSVDRLCVAAFSFCCLGVRIHRSHCSQMLRINDHNNDPMIKMYRRLNLLKLIKCINWENIWHLNDGGLNTQGHSEHISRV